MRKIQFALVFAAFIIYVLTLVVSYLNSTGLQDLFYNGIGYLGRKYINQIAPQPIVFNVIWPIIYLWNLIGIVYIVVSSFLSVERSPVKMSPTLVPKTFLISHCITFASATGWLFAFDREILGLSFALLILAALSAYATVGSSLKAVNDNVKFLEKNNKVVLWLMRIFVQNGLSLIATWLTVATLLNLTQLIIYDESYGMETAVMRGISIVNGSTISLVILLIIVITWFGLENFVLEKYCRYIITIYPVLIFALSSLIAKLRSMSDANQNLIIASVDLAVVLIAFITHVMLTVYRGNRQGIIV